MDFKYHCPNCGGEDVTFAAQVDANTHEVKLIDYEPGIHCATCNDTFEFCPHEYDAIDECPWAGHEANGSGS